jgi:ribonuclease D
MQDTPDTKDQTQLKKISKAEINNLPMIAWEGPIQILNTLEEMELAAETLLQETHLGFDTETRPTFKKGDYYPPSLVQFATADCVYLFRICNIDTLDPLIRIFESDNILKTGVAIKDDVKELLAVVPFEPDGFFEITKLTTELGFENKGLRPLAGLLLHGRISKGAQVSNWAKAELDEKQIRYAATDAWISRELFIKAKAFQESDSAT